MIHASYLAAVLQTLPDDADTLSPAIRTDGLEPTITGGLSVLVEPLDIDGTTLLVGGYLDRTVSRRDGFVSGYVGHRTGAGKYNNNNIVTDNNSFYYI
ncbi:MAG: hypothetical protein V5A40_15860 [Haloarculaceae archaeon]